jgi:Trypsin-like peptidase domain/Tetratricopeptide repeat
MVQQKAANGASSTMLASSDVYKAVVRLTNTSGLDNRESLGSGVAFTPTGLIITNNHVIEDADFGTAFGNISVESLRKIDRPPLDAVPAEVVVRNEVEDLAVIRVTGAPSYHFIDLLNTYTIDDSLMERRIRILGYPPLGGSTITVTRGIVSGFDDNGNLKTDAEINPGNSGGAALDDLGSFLGIPSFISVGSEGKLGFIITADRIKEWLRSVLKSPLPETTRELAAAFVNSNLNFAGDNLDRSNKYPRILAKFAAVETLLSRSEYEKAIPHIKFILAKRPRSALAYHYFGNALLGLGNYLEAAAQFRISLLYEPARIPALGNLGVALIHLGRPTEALHNFEQILDATDDPAELWTSYTNIGQIYEDWGKPQLAALYRQKANELSVAAQTRLSEYKPQRAAGDKVAALTDAIMNAEIELGDENA